MKNKQPSNESSVTLKKLFELYGGGKALLPEAGPNLKKWVEENHGKKFPVPGISRKHLPNRLMGEREQSELGQRVERLERDNPGYLSGMTEYMLSLPTTIEDEIPPVSQAFADKVKAEGGRITAMGIMADPNFKVEGKRYMRLARTFFCTVWSPGMYTVEDVEYHIRRYAARDKVNPNPDGCYGNLAHCINLGFKHRHIPNRKPVYAVESRSATRDLGLTSNRPFKQFPGSEL